MKWWTGKYPGAFRATAPHQRYGERWREELVPVGKHDASREEASPATVLPIASTSLLPVRRNEDDGCQPVEAAVKGVHFPPVRARDNPRRRGVPAKHRSATRQDAGQEAPSLTNLATGRRPR